MKGETRERSMQLAELAANEQDPDKLIAIVQEINKLLEEKEKRQQSRKSDNPT